MRVMISPGPVAGSLKLPPSKSLTHRYLLAGALSLANTEITNLYLSQDIQATLDILYQLKADFLIKGSRFNIDGTDFLSGKPQELQISESATTLRLLLPLLSLASPRLKIKLGARLAERPLKAYQDIWHRQKLQWKLAGNTLEIAGKLKPAIYKVAADKSSQFISGLLFALPLLAKKSTLIMTEQPVSVGYNQLTLKVLNDFGIIIEKQPNGYLIPAPQNYHTPGIITIEPDFSHAANFCVLAAVNSPLCLPGLSAATFQPDSKIISIIAQQGATVNTAADGYAISPGRLSGRQIDFTDNPDLAPIACVLAACSETPSNFTNIRNLKYKETNRLAVMKKELAKLGIRIELKANEATVYPWNQEKLTSTLLDCHNDHRILMAMAILATVSPHPLSIDNAEGIDKSYPSFFSDLAKLGVGITYKD